MVVMMRLAIGALVTCGCVATEPESALQPECAVNVTFDATTATGVINSDCAERTTVFVFNRASGIGLVTQGPQGALLLHFSAHIGDQIVVTLATVDRYASHCFELMNGIVPESSCGER